METIAMVITGFVITTVGIAFGYFMGFMAAGRATTQTTPKLMRKIQGKVDSALREPAVHVSQLTPKERLEMDDPQMQKFKSEVEPGVGHEQEHHGI